MKTIVMIMAAAVLAVAMMLAVGSCTNPPEGTVLVDVDGDGKADALAVDANADGQPDLDEEGNVKIVAGSSGYKIAEIADATGPPLLTTIGALLGASGIGAILAGLGVAWRTSKFGRILMNTIMTVQAARKALKDSGLPGALEIVDGELKQQTAETQAKVESLKTANGVPSVSDSS